jgi:uncharacterized repeat protein (TIGR03803 family)
MTYRQRTLATCGTLFLAFLISGSTVGAQTLTVYSFVGGGGGEVPMGNLAMADGPGGHPVLYGATYSDPSIVFSLTAPVSPGGAWTYAVVYTFSGGPGNGAGPYLPMGGVAMGSGGVLYGTTLNGGGGTDCKQSLGCGTVFSLTPPASPGGAWTEAVLYGFTGGSDGAQPKAGVLAGAGGVLYGTTSSGGTLGGGTVFTLTPPAITGGEWTEAVLHSFGGGPDGATPEGGVVASPDGGLYGTTLHGGTAGCGTVFALKPPASAGGPWTKETLYSFACAPDGSQPDAGVAMGGGVLYGSTQAGGTGPCSHGCGTLFSLAPPAVAGGAWTETVLHSFAGDSDGGSDGAVPTFAGVTIGNGGVLYGTTANGGGNGQGAVYSLTPPASAGGTWTEVALGFELVNNASAGPYGGLTLGPDGVLYGTSTAGGARNNGTVFAWKP